MMAIVDGNGVVWRTANSSYDVVGVSARRADPVSTRVGARQSLRFGLRLAGDKQSSTDGLVIGLAGRGTIGHLVVLRQRPAKAGGRNIGSAAVTFVWFR